MSQELIKRILSSLLLFPLVLFAIVKGGIFFNLFILICFLITCYEWQKMSKNKSYNILGFIFLLLSFFTIYKLRIFPTNDYWLILSITFICISTDIGGYLFGKLLKGPKLTKFSPNKTYAGVFGGYILSLITISVLINVLNYSDKSLIISNIFLVILISTVSQTGDIIISYFKRLSKIKDTGKIIPGHGGLLDRIDGMLFSFPFIYLVSLTNLF